MIQALDELGEQRLPCQYPGHLVERHAQEPTKRAPRARSESMQGLHRKGAKARNRIRDTFVRV
jgi:hypothetical protein